MTAFTAALRRDAMATQLSEPTAFAFPTRPPAAETIAETTFRPTTSRTS